MEGKINNLNVVVIEGYVGNDPNVNVTSKNTPVMHFDLAVNEVWRGKQNLINENTNWMKITIWADLAMVLKDFIKKGRRLLIEGKLHQESDYLVNAMAPDGKNGWVELKYQDGSTVKVRQKGGLTVVAKNVLFLDKKIPQTQNNAVVSPQPQSVFPTTQQIFNNFPF